MDRGFSMLQCNDSENRRMKLVRPGVKKKKVTFATDLSSSSTNKSDFRKKLEEETFKLLCERNCIECFKRERSLLFYHVIMLLCVLRAMYLWKLCCAPSVIKK